MMEIFIVAAWMIIQAASGFDHEQLGSSGFDHSTAAQLLKSKLQLSNNTVQQGAYSFFFLSDCSKYDLPSCFALNADSPYGMTLLPSAPDEPEYRGCISKTGRCGNGCNPSNDPELSKSVCIDELPMQWRIGKDEAIILLGETPPKSKYWSITGYLMSHFYDQSSRTKEANFSTWTQKVAVSCQENGPARCQNFASLGQPYNYLTGGFKRPFAYVLTASTRTFKTIKSSIETLIPEIKQVILLPLPDDLLHLGTDDDSKDMLTQLMRIAYPENNTEMQEYYKRPPISVLRVTPTQAPPTQAPRTQAPPTQTPANYYSRRDVHFLSRLTGQQESGGRNTSLSSSLPLVSHTQLLEDLEVLANGIREKHGIGIVLTNSTTLVRRGPPLRADSYTFMRPFFTTGLDCIDDGTECNGDTADTLYPISGNIYKARGCQLIPVLRIGAVATAVLTIVLICCNVLCRRCIGTNKLKFVQMAGEDGMKKTKNKNKDNNKNSKNSKNGITFLGVVIAFIVSCLVCLVPSIYIFGNTCDWGHAASMDSSLNDVFIVYGINHQQTGHAQYASITAYRFSHLSGIVSVSSEVGYQDSANKFLPGGSQHRSSNYLFAHSFARDCQKKEHCFEVPFEGDEKLPLNEFVFWIERMYVNPTSKTGPASNETIMARVIHVW